jgi:hypothetical protein
MRTDEDLRELLPHLCYEIKMLLTTDLLLMRETETPRDPIRLDEWTIHNALFESHTLHARALYAFFFQGPRKSGDAVASDYVTDWHRKRPKPAVILSTVSRRVGKEIAHLSYGRLAYKTDEDRQWAFTDVTKALIAVINAWLTKAPEYIREALLHYIKDYSAQSEILATSRQR